MLENISHISTLELRQFEKKKGLAGDYHTFQLKEKKHDTL